MYKGVPCSRSAACVDHQRLPRLLSSVAIVLLLGTLCRGSIHLDPRHGPQRRQRQRLQHVEQAECSQEKVREAGA